MAENNQIVIDDDSDEEEIVEEECPDCGKVFTDLNELASHYFSTHEAAKRAAKKTSSQNENSSGAKMSQNPTSNQTTSIEPPALSSAPSSSSTSQNTSSTKMQIAPGTGVQTSISHSKSPDSSMKPTILGNPSVSNNALSLKQKQLNAREQNNQNSIHQGKIMEKQKIDSEGQIKMQAKPNPKGQVQGQCEPVKRANTSQPSVQSQIKVQAPSIKNEQINQPMKKTQPEETQKDQIKEKVATNSASPMVQKRKESEVLNVGNETASKSINTPSQGEELQNKPDIVPNNDELKETYTALLVQYFKENDLPFKPRVRNKSDGNCWYEAIADQVVLHGIKDMPTTHEGMRKAICDALFTLPQTKSWIKNLFGGQKKRFVNFVNKHRKNGEWTDAKGLICQASALMLKRNIHIVGTANKGQSVCYTKLESVEEAEKFPALTVGYYQDQHYHSIEKIDVAAKVDENLRVGGKIVRTPIATKPLRKMPTEKTDTDVHSTEALNPTKVEGKTVREPIVSKPLRKIPTESNAANEKSNDSKENNIKESKTDATGKIERIPIVSKPLRKTPTESNAANEKSNDSKENNLKESKADGADKAGKIERIPIVSKPLRKFPVETSATNQINKNKDHKPIADKEQDTSKIDGKMPRLPIATKPLRKENSTGVTDRGDKMLVEPFAEIKAAKEMVKATQTPIIPKALVKNNGAPVDTSNNEAKYTGSSTEVKTNVTSANRTRHLARSNLLKKDENKKPKDINKMAGKPTNNITIDVDSFDETKLQIVPKDNIAKPAPNVSKNNLEPIPSKPINNIVKNKVVNSNPIPTTDNNVSKDKLAKPNPCTTSNNVLKDLTMKQNVSQDLRVNPISRSSPNVSKDMLTKQNPSIASNNVLKDKFVKQTPNLPNQGTIVQKNQTASNVTKPVQGKIITNNPGKPTQVKAQSSILKPSKFSLAARNKLLKNSAIKIQRWFRNIRKGRLVREAFQKKRRAAIVLQKHWRSVLARKRVRRMKATLKIEAWYTKRKANKTKAAISLQSRWKSVKTRKQYLLKKNAAITFQKNFRTIIAKRLATNIRKCKGAAKIQKWFRNVKIGRIIRKDFLRKKRAAMTIQPHWRSYLAQCKGPSFQLNTPDEHLMNPETGEVELATEYIINAETGQLEMTPVDLGDYVNKMTEFMEYGTLSKMANKTWKKSKLKNRLVSSLQSATPRKCSPQAELYEEKESNSSKGPPLYLPARKSVEIWSSEEDVEVEEEMFYNEEETLIKDQDYFGKSNRRFGSFQSPLIKSTTPECFVKAEKNEMVDKLINHILDGIFPSPKLDESFKFSDWRINSANQQKSWFQIKVETKKASDKSEAILTIQSHWRGFKVRRSFLKVKNAAVQIQIWFKNIRNTRMTRENYLKKQMATVTLQSHIRSFLQRKKFVVLKKSVTFIQSKRKMILQKRTFDELKAATIKIQKWYKNIRFGKAFLLYNPEVTSIEKNLKEYVEENKEYVSFSNINEIAFENRAGFNIRTKVFSKFQPQILEHRKNDNIQINVSEEDIDPVKDHEVRTLDGLVIVPEHSTDVTREKHDLDADFDDSNFEDIEESKVVPSFNVFGDQSLKGTEASNKKIMQKKRGAAKNIETRKIVEHTLESILEKVCSQESFFKTLSISEEIDFFNAAQIEKEKTAKSKMYRFSFDEMYNKQESNCINQFISARKEFITSRAAPTKIQRWLRNIKAGRVLRKDFLRKKRAATTIQAYRRSLVTRREFQTMRAETANAATLLQSHWKSLVTRRQFCKKKESALQIQSWFRIVTVRKVLRKEFIQKKVAVKTIQSYWRAAVARRQLVKTKAATVLQSCWKAFAASRIFARTKDSTIKIQRWFRNIQKGRNVRTAFLEKKNASIKIQAQWRGLVARKKWDNHKFSKSIVNDLLDEAVRQNRAATILQSVWRSWVVRKKFLVEKKIVVKAATTIQCEWKMLVVRKQFLKEKEACIKIQKWTRNLKVGKEKRKEFMAMKVSSVVLQSHWRGFLARRKCTALVTVNSVINDLLEDAAFPRSIAEEIVDDAVGNALVPRENVDSILSLIISDIFRPKVPVKSLKKYGKPSSKKRTSMPNSLKRKNDSKGDLDEVVVKKKKVYNVSKEGDLENLYFKRKRTDSVSKEGDLEEFVVKNETVESLSDVGDIVAKRKRDEDIVDEDIVVVKEVKRSQTDFMVENVSLPTKKSNNDFDALNFKQTLNNIKETLNIIKDLPQSNAKNDPILDNMKEDPDIIEIYAPTSQSSTKTVGRDINVVETIFKCPECFSSFTVSSEYQNHITTICIIVKAEPVVKIEPETIEEIRCNLCEATFLDDNGMQIHRTFFHGGRELQLENHSMSENASNKGKARLHKAMVPENSTENGFEKQNLEHLFKNIEQKIKSAKKVPQSVNASQAIPKETTSASEGLKINKENINTEMPIQVTKCDECGKLRKRKETKKAALVWLLNHRKECSSLTNSKPFKCAQCSSSFSSNAALSAHKIMCRPNENVKAVLAPSEPKPVSANVKPNEPPTNSKKKLAKQLSNRLKAIEMYEEKEKALMKKRKIPRGDGLTSHGYNNGMDKRKYNKKIRLDNTIVDNIRFIDK